MVSVNSEKYVHCVSSCTKYKYGSQCVGTCPGGDTPTSTNSCKTCAEASSSEAIDAQTNYFDGEKCVKTCDQTSVNNICMTCAEAAAKEAVEDNKLPFWDPNTKKCTKQCSETSKDGICKKCSDLSTESPVWSDGECVSCAEKEPTTPVWDESVSKCRACTSSDGGELWDPMTWKCAATCASGDKPATGTTVCKSCEEMSSGKKEAEQTNFFDGTKCVAACPELAPAFGDDKVCTTCKKLLGDENTEKIYWAWDKHDGECEAECEDSVISISGTRCLETCPEGQTNSEGKCVCAEKSVLAATRDGCVVPGKDSGCQRHAEIDGAQTCIADKICQGELKLEKSGDGFTCVKTCEKTKYSEDEKSKELKCVDKCEHWWYKEQKNGLCKKEAWRKNTAIAVPIVIVVLAGVAVALVFLLKKKGSCGGTDRDAVSMKQGKVFDKA